MRDKLLKIFKESVMSVLPIVFVVFALYFVLDFTKATFFSFGISMILIVIGITLFTFGSEVSMEIIGEKIGRSIIRHNGLISSMIILFILGVALTIAEPDLRVLAEQMTSIPNLILILTVGAGVGLFLVLSIVKTRYSIDLSKILVGSYLVVFAFVIFTQEEFIPLAFDSGGVTTGPVSVPFLVALGLGLSSLNTSKEESDSNFGIVGLCSIGPILSVLLLGLIFNLESDYMPNITDQYYSINQFFKSFINNIPTYLLDVTLAIVPIILIYYFFQKKYKITRKKEVKKIITGFVFTFVGLVLFLIAANTGLMGVGSFIGEEIAKSDMKFILVPFGFVLGFFTVQSEPAVRVLTAQIENITSGAIKKNVINLFLSIGVGVAVALALLRCLTGISILYVIIPVYALGLILTIVSPKLFTAIAFDSGGAASGPMTATFLLPLAIGATYSVHGNPMTDAFGLVALVAAAPLVMIQLLGVVFRIKEKISENNVLDTTIVTYDWKGTE